MTATRPGHRQGEALSVQTLVIAAVASAVAAIVTSTFWRGGTIVTATMTPVIVAITKELLARPMRSELVRRPAARVRSMSTTVPRTSDPRAPVSDARTHPGAARRATAPPRAFPGDGARAGAPRRRRDALDHRTAAPVAGEVIETAPLRRYGRVRRRPRLKLALATGIAAFAVALVALTVPELIFGGSVASHGSTTLFGGGSSHSSSAKHGGSSSSGGSSSTTTTQTAPARPRTHTQTSTAPGNVHPQTTTQPSTKTPTTTAPQSSAPTTQSPTPAPKK